VFNFGNLPYNANIMHIIEIDS